MRVLVLPFYRRYWLLHAWRASQPQSAAADAAAGAHMTPHDTSLAAAAARSWQQGATLQDKVRGLGGALQAWGARTADAQWHKLVAAPEGTFNHRLYRWVGVSRRSVLRVAHLRARSAARGCVRCGRCVAPWRLALLFAVWCCCHLHTTGWRRRRSRAWIPTRAS